IRLNLENRARIPFDILIDICARVNLQPGNAIIESLIKGLKKQKALDELIASKGFDKWDSRLTGMRNELLEQKLEHNKKFKENMVEKFEFLRNQRMTEQAGKVLKRLIELYPDDKALADMRQRFD